MKTKATMLAIMALLFCVPAKSADLYVNNSGQSGTYTTIQAAINAASTGDNIYVSPLNSYQESLSITKSIRIASSVSGSRIIVTSNIIISPLANILVELIGIEGTNVLLGTQTSTLGPNSRGRAIITDCSFHDVNFDKDYFTSIVVKCDLSGSLTARHGKVLGCVVSESINFHDEPNVGVGDTINVKANFVEGEIKIETNDHSTFISNNVANGIRVGKWVNTSLLSCEITNNTLNVTNAANHRSGSYWNLQPGIINLQSASTSDFSKISIINNKAVLDINNVELFTSSYDRNAYTLVGIDADITVTKRPLIQYNFWALNARTYNYYSNTITASSSSTSSTPLVILAYYSEIYRVGSTRGGTNGELVYSSNPASLGINNVFWDLKSNLVNDVYDLNSFSNVLKDVGSPSPKFFDTDLTRSDIGHLGGDNSWEMFHGPNSVSGAAYIIGLDLPSEIWPGQTVNLKAEAVHTN